MQHPLDSIMAEKLLRILRPFRPNAESAFCPGFLCAGEALLRINGIEPASFKGLPPTIYDGIDHELKMEGDEVIEKRPVHVFMKHGLEQCLNGKEVNFIERN